MEIGSGKPFKLSISLLNLLKYALVLSSYHYLMVNNSIMLFLVGTLMLKQEMSLVLDHES